MSQRIDTTGAPLGAGQDTLASIRDHRDAVENLAERDDRMGAAARYFLAVADGECPTARDAELAGLPRPNPNA